MNLAESTSFLLGSLRLTASLAAVILAALFFIRVRLINIALDGQIALSAIIYVGVSGIHGPFVGMFLSAIASATVGIALALSSLTRKSDSILLSFGFLYVCLGLAATMSAWISGQAGNSPLNSARALGEPAAFVLLAMAVGLALLCILYWRSLRLSKVIGESDNAGNASLATLSGIWISRWTIINVIFGSLLLTIVAAFLVEQGGGYTKLISGERGFLALAIVVVARNSPLLCVVVAIMFGMGKKAAMGSSEFSEVFQAFPFLLALVLLAGLGLRSRLKEKDSRMLLRRVPR